MNHGGGGERAYHLAESVTVYWDDQCKMQITRNITPTIFPRNTAGYEWVEFKSSLDEIVREEPRISYCAKEDGDNVVFYLRPTVPSSSLHLDPFNSFSDGFVRVVDGDTLLVTFNRSTV
ncbi:hypothetical protein KHV-MN_00081 [Cyprinid herpesvirus 3]|nr:hypothetical protein KHV-MN_00081 [Cyprinid herpesvirus 3]